MKNKIYKILGVALVIVMLTSLTVGLVAVPAGAAAPKDNEWTKFAYPEVGADGDWFWDDTITYVGPLAMAINGDLYCAADVDDADYANHLMKSEDGGRTWSKTDYAKDLKTSGSGGGNAGRIVDIACSSENADVVYVADTSKVYSTEDGGDAWSAVAGDSLGAVFITAGGTQTITSLDVGYIDGEPYVFIGTDDTTLATYNGGVYYIKDVGGFAIAWTDLNLTAGYDVYTVNCPPNFEDSAKVFAVITKAVGPVTRVVTSSGEVGGWSAFGGDFYLVTGPPPTSPIQINAASDICFPDDFDGDELFVGVSTTTTEGSVYRVIKDIAYAYRLGNYDTTVEDKDIISLDITGGVGSTLLLAGAQDTTDVFYSTDDGDSWDAADKAPSGTYATYVLMAEDFADSNEAWAGTSGDECALSYTIDGGDLWNQISLINTGMDGEVLSFSFYPDYETSGKLFMVTDENSGDESLWRYDGTYWERVLVDDLIDSDDIYWVEVSPEILTDGTVYITDWPDAEDTAPTGYRSTDEGQSWKELRCHADELFGAIVIDADTVLAGGDSEVDRTTDHGNRVWKDIDPKIDGYIYWFARSGDNVLAASDNGEVALSEDLGATWARVGEDGDIYDDITYVAFDTDYATNNIIYATSDTYIYRFEVGEDTNWTEIFDDVVGNASGIATADGCLYVSDYTDGEGMWRSVNPTADPARVLFERVGDNFELDTSANMWWLKTTSGSNVLWALDFGWGDDLENTIWTYTDTLVGPVELATPATGTALGRITTATLTWKELSGDADIYDLKVYADKDFSDAYQIFDDETGSAQEVYRLGGLPAGSQFWWKVRVSPGDPLASKWSTAWSFATAMGAAEWNPFQGPVSEAPYPGQTNVPLRPAFAWNVADWATGYEFELSTAPGTTAGGFFVDALVGMTGTNALVNTVWQCNIDLAYSTAYYWHVRAKSATSTSNWATGVFTTMAAPVEVVPPPPPVQIPPLPAPISPAWIWAVVIIGAILVIAVIVLIVTTRRVP